MDPNRFAQAILEKNIELVKQETGNIELNNVKFNNGLGLLHLAASSGSPDIMAGL